MKNLDLGNENKLKSLKIRQLKETVEVLKRERSGSRQSAWTRAIRAVSTETARRSKQNNMEDKSVKNPMKSPAINPNDTGDLVDEVVV